MKVRTSELVTTRMVRQLLTGRGAGLIAAALLTATFPGSAKTVESSADEAGSSERKATVLLEYQETGYPVLYRNVLVQAAPSRSTEEQAVAPARIHHGVLRFGNDPSNAVAFVWQTGLRRLILDLNHNPERAGDPERAFSGRELFSVPGGCHQVFTNVHLSFPATSAGAPMMMDLEMAYSGRDHKIVVVAALRSLWQGKVSWGGQEWQVGLVPNLSDRAGSLRQGQLLLRPWDERDKAFQGRCDPLDTRMMGGYWRDVVLRAPETFAVGPGVFFGGQAGQLDWAADPRGCGEKLAVELAARPAALGDLRISGSSIRRLVLEGGPFVVVLAHPEASVRVPVGSYYPRSVWLQRGRTEAYFRFGVPTSGKVSVMDEITGAQLPIISSRPAGQVVVVDGGRPGLMLVGGPLTNCVSATHAGREVHLGYQLRGVGGGEYRPVGRDFDSEPQFTIREGGLRVGGGKFEFG